MSGPTPSPAALVDPEAERAVLGAILVEPSNLPAVEAVLRVEHLSSPQHRAIYTAMLHLGAGNRGIDGVTLRDELARAHGLEAAGGMAYLAGLVDGLPRLENAEHWARLVREKARRRHVVEIARRAIQEAQSEEHETDEVVDRAQTGLSRLMEGGDRAIVRLRDVLPVSLRQLEVFAAAPEGVTGIPTGLLDFDRVTSGLQPGALYVIAARSGRGKSAFVAQSTMHAASTGKRALVFCMEMLPASLGRRILLQEAEVDPWALSPRTAEATRDYSWRRVLKAYGEVIDYPVYFDPRESPNLAQVRASCKQQRAHGGLDLVVVDYLQRMTVDPKLDRWLAIGDIAKGLKSLARELKVPVLAACQLNADAEDKRPTTAMLGQAQSIISAEADVIAFLHPADLAAWKTQPFPHVDLIVDKNREGGHQTVRLSFEKHWTRFVSMQQPKDEEEMVPESRARRTA